MKRYWAIEIKGKYIGTCFATEEELSHTIQNRDTVSILLCRVKHITFTPNRRGKGGLVSLT